jgi:hypothetical protein
MMIPTLKPDPGNTGGGMFCKQCAEREFPFPRFAKFIRFAAFPRRSGFLFGNTNL